MSIGELFVISVGLSMDAFAVSVCKGLSFQEMRLRNALIVGLYFGSFQALMPAIGYFLGACFQDAIAAYDHWIAFILLNMIGINMIREALNTEEETCDASIHIKDMLLLAIATSIDALAAGVTFPFLQVPILPALSLIGATTFFLSILGVKTGVVFGCRYKSRAELAGGYILIFMGTKILLEHLFF